MARNPESPKSPIPVEEAARYWAEAGSPHVAAVLHFGSTRSGAAPGARSAHDFFLVVDDDLGFYRALRSRGHTRRSPRLLSTLNRVLTPNVLHGAGSAGEAKLFVITDRALRKAAGRGAPDHFVRARLCQDVAPVFVRDRAAESLASTALHDARDATVYRMRPVLRGSFGALDFARRLIEVSYGSEIRPEAPGRALEVFASQRSFFAAEYPRVLARAEQDGILSSRGGEWAYLRSAGGLDRLAARLWFAMSRARATLRWAKYIVTFEDWLGYIAAKVERRTGTRVELTARERRWPFLLLWPKFWRVMRARRPAGGGAS